MKLSTFAAKLTSGKVLSVLGGLAVAGAAMTVAAPAAQAQRFAVGVQFGAPAYVETVPVVPRPVYRPYNAYGYAPGYYGYGRGYDAREYWEHRRAEEWREHERFERQRERDFYGRRDRGW